VKHHFIGHVSVHETYTAGRYAREARAFIDLYFKEKDALVICGGTGLYIQALLEGIDRMPVPEEIRLEVAALLQKEGLEAAAAQMLELDSDLASQTDLNNPRRVQRALEWLLSGRPETVTNPIPNDWQVQKLAPEWPREELYNRINCRVDLMMEAGLWQEAESLYPLQHLNALHTVGYREIFDCLDGQISKEQAIEKIKQHTRNYAKRQLTWFRNDKEILWLEKGNLKDFSL
jgi:tRNA dimethylallyltransferase